ncbi:MAG: hypothetical protein NTU59_01130, partial [Coprothermobacterota bacterium]|nr:hypothetical protein [Coprothermobacterota bacterium]
MNPIVDLAVPYLDPMLLLQVRSDQGAIPTRLTVSLARRRLQQYFLQLLRYFRRQAAGPTGTLFFFHSRDA